MIVGEEDEKENELMRIDATRWGIYTLQKKKKWGIYMTF